MGFAKVIKGETLRFLPFHVGISPGSVLVRPLSEAFFSIVKIPLKFSKITQHQMSERLAYMANLKFLNLKGDFFPFWTLILNFKFKGVWQAIKGKISSLYPFSLEFLGDVNAEEMAYMTTFKFLVKFVWNKFPKPCFIGCLCRRV